MSDKREFGCGVFGVNGRDWLYSNWLNSDCCDIVSITYSSYRAVISYHQLISIDICRMPKPYYTHGVG